MKNLSVNDIYFNIHILYYNLSTKYKRMSKGENIN